MTKMKNITTVWASVDGFLSDVARDVYLSFDRPQWKEGAWGERYWGDDDEIEICFAGFLHLLGLEEFDVQPGDLVKLKVTVEYDPDAVEVVEDDDAT